MADILAAREAAAFYGGIGSLLYGVAHGTPIVRINRSTTTADDAHENRFEVIQQDILQNETRIAKNRDTQPGPKELGLDVLAEPNEAPEEALWPVTLREIAITLARRLPLSQIEGRWLARVGERKGEDFVRKALGWATRRARIDLGLN